MRPKVAFIGTGGTIASVGVGPLDLQNYGATGNVMHAEEIIARWPETALVADVLPVRYRNIPSTAIDLPTGGHWCCCASSLSLSTPISRASSSATARRPWRRPPTS
jgi:L-asparaginase